MASFPFKIIRFGFALGERLAPALAGRAAFELFRRTPARRSLSPNEVRAVERAAPFMQEARHHRLRTRHGCVAVHEFRPAPGRGRAGSVLVVHGWRSRTEYMRAAIEGLRAAGFRVLSLDLPGHGQSSGRILDLARAVGAVAAAESWFGPFAAIVGHSFGGAVAVNAAAGSIRGVAAVDAARLVLISAPESLPGVFDQFGRSLNLGPRSHKAIGRQVLRVAGRPLGEFLGGRQLARIGTPTLVVHAHDDREVDAVSAEQFDAAGPHVRLHWADGLGHRRILADPGVVASIVDFVAEPVPVAGEPVRVS